MAGASLPKRALSASATCPAGTIGTAVGAVARGAFGGHSDCGASTPPGAERRRRAWPAPARAARSMGAAENSEFCPAACADAALRNAAKAAMSASAGHSRPRAAIAGAVLMARPFSAEIAAISSQ